MLFRSIINHRCARWCDSLDADTHALAQAPTVRTTRARTRATLIAAVCGSSTVDKSRNGAAPLECDGPTRKAVVAVHRMAVRVGDSLCSEGVSPSPLMN